MYGPRLIGLVAVALLVSLLCTLPAVAQPRLGRSEMHRRAVPEGALEEACIGTDCLGVLTRPNGEQYWWRHGRRAERRVPVNRREDQPVRRPTWDVFGTAAAPSPTIAVGDAVVQDVVVAGTSRAIAAAGGWVAFQNLVALSVASANRSYANSGVALTLNLAGVIATTYVESGDMAGDLNKLSDSVAFVGGQWVPSPYMQDVRDARNALGGDSAMVIISGYGCGISNLLTANLVSYQGIAYEVAELGCVANNRTFQHEIGHTQGLQHDHANAGSQQGVTAYAYGYNTPAWRTIMSYGGQPRIEYFSSPTAIYQGTPTGVADYADNARALTLTAATVAQFRRPSAECTYGLTANPVMAGGGASRLFVTAPSGCGWRMRTPVPWLKATNGQDAGFATTSIGLTVAANAGTTRSAVLTVETASIVFTQPGVLAAGALASPRNVGIGARP